jgi:PIN domain nuclease of toxin-antitoxin system
VRVLLDTHAFLWFIMGDARLTAAARGLIEDANNERLVSAGSLWEITIKVSIGKLTLTEPFEVIIPRELSQNGFQILPITVPHLTVLCGLPFHHRDPFDRLLVAQAMAEKMPLVSVDSVVDAYPITRLW